MYLNSLTYLFLSFSILSFWISSNKNIPVALFIISTILAVFSKIINPIALISIIAMIGLFYLFYNKTLSNISKIIVFILILAVSALLMAHKIPGYNNWEIYDYLKLSELSAPFSMWLNFDKGLIAFALLYAVNKKPLILNDYKLILKHIFPIFLILALILSHFATLFDYLAFDPKIIDAKLLAIWIIRMICLTVVVEELFFRFFIQGTFSKLFYRFGMKGELLACFLAALIFALFHFSGGIMFVVLAFIAGLLYGGVYIKTKKIEASIILHFLINFTHLMLFSYPSLQT